MRPLGRGSLLGLMRLLALDTSTATASVAVVDDGCVLSEINRRIATGHAAHLLGLVEQALTLSGLRLDELDALAIGRGPGSFTGLRAGFATIRGLELARLRSTTGHEDPGQTTHRAKASKTKPTHQAQRSQPSEPMWAARAASSSSETIAPRRPGGDGRAVVASARGILGGEG